MDGTGWPAPAPSTRGPSTELPPDDVTKAAAPGLRDQVSAVVRSAGFRFVAVDLAGIQSGAFTLPLVAVGRG